MNETELRTLVEHDRTRHEVGPAPTGAILERSRSARTRRRGAWAAGVAALAVAVSARLAVVAALPDSRPAAHPSGPVDPNPNDAFVPPPGMRWAGLNGFVLAVPARWSTQFTQFCADSPPGSVTFDVPGQETGSCRGAASAPGPPLRGHLYVATSTNSGRALQRYGWRREPIGDATAYFSPVVSFQSGGLVTGAVEVAGHVAFAVDATSRPAVHRILASLRPVPRGLALVPPPVADLSSTAVAEHLRTAGFRADYAEEPSPSWMQNHYPGLFIRTDPPVGTPLPPGSTVTVYANDGPLGLYVGTKPLREHHWSVAPPSDFTPRVSRARAVDLAGLGEPTSWRTALLRRLTIPGTAVRDRDVWMAVRLRIPNYGPDVSDVTVIDATTGRQLAHDTFVH